MLPFPIWPKRIRTVKQCNDRNYFDIHLFQSLWLMHCRRITFSHQLNSNAQQQNTDVEIFNLLQSCSYMYLYILYYMAIFVAGHCLPKNYYRNNARLQMWTMKGSLFVSLWRCFFKIIHTFQTKSKSIYERRIWIYTIYSNGNGWFKLEYIGINDGAKTMWFQLKSI